MLIVKVAVKQPSVFLPGCYLTATHHSSYMVFWLMHILSSLESVFISVLVNDVVDIRTNRIKACALCRSLSSCEQCVCVCVCVCAGMKHLSFTVTPQKKRIIELRIISRLNI